MRQRLMAELHAHSGGPVHLYHLSSALPNRSAFDIRDVLDGLVRDGLVATCPQRGRDYWRAIGECEQSCLLSIKRRLPDGRARPTVSESALLNQLIQTRYPLGGAEAVLAVTSGVTENMIKVRASRLGVTVAR